MSRYGERTRVTQGISGFGRKSASVSPLPKLVTFTSTTTYTIPSDVTYVIANITGGGGGTFVGATAATDGGSSSVAFAAGTKTAVGGTAGGSTNTTFVNTNRTQSAGVRFGEGAMTVWANASLAHAKAHDGAFLRVGGVVTPSGTLVVTVGAGGSAGTNGSAGKAGVVTLEAYAGNTMRCDAFLASGTFTPPASVTLVNATIIAGGGSSGQGDWTGVVGGNSSVAFSAGTQTATGGYPANANRFGFEQYQSNLLPVSNSGRGGILAWAGTTTNVATFIQAGHGQIVETAQTVTPLTGITVTVGAGGAGYLSPTGVGAGGSGVVWFEYSV